MPKTSPAAKQARREQIVQAAVRCFARKGYYATTIEDLVAETGMSRGALYLYFSNKEALYLALADRWDCGLQEAIQQRVTPGMSPGAVIEVIIEVTGSQVAADAAACHILMEGWTLAQVIPELGVQVRRQQEQARAVFEQLLQAGVRRGEMRADLPIALHAQMLTALLEGLMVEWHLHPGTVNWRHVGEETVRSLSASKD